MPETASLVAKPLGLNFIFLHGGGQGNWVWKEAMDALQVQARGTHCHCLALDVPGCGSKRGQPTDTLGVSDVVADLLADIDKAGIENPILVGHSQAGTMLPRLVKMRPTLFRHVVYVSCLAPLGQQTGLSWIAQMPAADSALLENHRPGSGEFFQRMFCNDMERSAAEAFLDKLGRDQWPASTYQATEWAYEHLSASPSTYVLCLRDTALPPSWQQIFAARLQVKEIVRIDAGHQVMNTRPHALAEVLRSIAGR
jgi:pimeloyl-ACP methyl ester carboxylesterase